eukprot:1153245-Pelagomonas_calceolata.AAC.2
MGERAIWLLYGRRFDTPLPANKDAVEFYQPFKSRGPLAYPMDNESSRSKHAVNKDKHNAATLKLELERRPAYYKALKPVLAGISFSLMKQRTSSTTRDEENKETKQTMRAMHIIAYLARLSRVLKDAYDGLYRCPAWRTAAAAAGAPCAACCACPGTFASWLRGAVAWKRAGNAGRAAAAKTVGLRAGTDGV